MAKIKVVTHPGSYHADDIFAVATLELVLGQEPTIIRTRDPELIKQGDYVVDVGQIYDPKKKRFDHHQEEGAGERLNGIPYASFGLVWKEYGEKLCVSKEAAEYIDERLVQAIDGPDNGVNIFSVNDKDVRPYLVQDVFQAFQPLWNEDTEHDQVFGAMVDLAKRILSREIEVAHEMVEAKIVIRTVYENSDDKRLIVFSKDHPFGRGDTTLTLAEFPEPIYAVMFRPTHHAWQVASVTENPNTMISRKPLPEAWRGKKDEELQKITGVKEAFFCHRAGFMAMSRNKEGALELARKALEE